MTRAEDNLRAALHESMRLNGDLRAEERDMTQRFLSEADLELLANKVVDKLHNRFYRDVGKGIINWALGIILAALLAFAGWRLGKGS